MKAAVFNRYGGNEVVEIREAAKPVCGPDDVLIRVRAASINPVDWKVRYGHARLLTRGRFPKILGNECSGEITAAGSRVHTLKQGDRVIGRPSIRRLGAFAEYVCVGQGSAVRMHKHTSFEQAACIPIAGLTALQALRDYGRISHGKKVLINGASGGVGHFAVQIAKIFGAEVTGVCSRSNISFVQALGADRVIDYTIENFTKGGDRYDIIFDAVAKSSLTACRKIMTSHGIYISTLPSVSVIINQYVTGYLSPRKAKTIWVRQSEADLNWIMSQIEANRIRVVIEKAYPLDQVKEALALSEAGKVRGKLVVQMEKF